MIERVRGHFSPPGCGITKHLTEAHTVGKFDSAWVQSNVDAALGRGSLDLTAGATLAETENIVAKLRTV